MSFFLYKACGRVDGTHFVMMSATWKVILFSRLARLKNPKLTVTTGPYKALKFSIKKPTNTSERLAIKIDLRVQEQDRAPIGVTLTLPNWNWLLDAIEAKENDIATLERETGSLYISRNEHGECLVYTEESSRIFGVALSTDECESLVSFRQAFNLLFAFVRNPSDALLKEICFSLFAYAIYEEGRSLLKGHCQACEIDEDLLEILQRKHTCVKSFARDEDFPMDTFLDQANLPSISKSFEQKLLKLNRVLEISDSKVTALRQTFVSSNMDSPLIKERILNVHKDNEKLGALLELMLEPKDTEPIYSSPYGEKRRRQNFQMY